MLEIGCPKHPRELRRRFGPYVLSVRQKAAFAALVADNLLVGRPHSDIRCSEGGRGIATLQGMLGAFADACDAMTCLTSQSISYLVSGSPLPVKPERVAVCDPFRGGPPRGLALGRTACPLPR